VLNPGKGNIMTTSDATVENMKLQYHFDEGEVVLFSPGIGVIDPCMISTFCPSCLATFTYILISREVLS